jgi:hypothetical protein
MKWTLVLTVPALLLVAIWPFRAAPPNPQCGVNSECVTISRPTDTASSGVRKPVASVYRAGKKIQFKPSPDMTLGPFAVAYDLNKTDSTPEVILFQYK